jgi:hypothetical protein
MSYPSVPLFDVFKPVMRRLGLNPDTPDLASMDLALSVSDHINERVRKGWFYWPFPEFTLTEERAFRPVWNGSLQFYAGDELFYIPTFKYYRVTGNPPVGTPPTAPTDDFEEFTCTDCYIAWNQVCRKTISSILAVYPANPDNGACYPRLPIRPSSRGINVYGDHGATVFVNFQRPVPRFTLQPFMQGRTYALGDLAFFPETKDCFIATNNAGAYWQKVLFPEVLSEYVKGGVYADCLLETDIGDSADKVQTRNAKAAIAAAEAEENLTGEIDSLIAQGQRYHWQAPRRYWHPWSSDGVVTTLTDACDSDYGPVPPEMALGATFQYMPWIVSLTGPEPSLAGVPTNGLLETSAVLIIIVVGGSRQDQTYQLRHGAADPADPGHVAPQDYSPTTNNKHWERTG